MKKVLLFTIMLLLFPMVASAKTLNITALVDSNIKENVTELLVTFDSSIGEDGVVDYSLNKSKNFKRTIKNWLTRWSTRLLFFLTKCFYSSKLIYNRSR